MQLIDNNNNNKSFINLCWHKGGSPRLVVMGRDSRSEGRGFKSQYRILDGHFSHIFVVKIVMLCVWKEAGIGPFLKKNLCWHQFVRENAIIKTHLGTENRTYWQLSKCLYAFIKVQRFYCFRGGSPDPVFTYGKPSTTYKWERGRG